MFVVSAQVRHPPALLLNVYLRVWIMRAESNSEGWTGSSTDHTLTHLLLYLFWPNFQHWHRSNIYPAVSDSSQAIVKQFQTV